MALTCSVPCEIDHDTQKMWIIVRRISVTCIYFIYCFFWEEMGPCALDHRWKGPFTLLSATRPKVKVMTWSCFNAFGKHSSHFCDSSINALMQKGTFLPSRQHFFSRHIHAFFNRTIQSHVLHMFQRLRKKRVLDCPAGLNCSQQRTCGEYLNEGCKNDDLERSHTIRPCTLPNKNGTKNTRIS